MGVGRELPTASEEEATRHPEVNQEYATALEPNNQILAAPVDRRDALPGERGGHGLRLERTREALVEDRHVAERASQKLRLEAAPDCLDLGKLGHGTSLAWPWSPTVSRRSCLGRSIASWAPTRPARTTRARPEPPRPPTPRRERGSPRARRLPPPRRRASGGRRCRPRDRCGPPSCSAPRRAGARRRPRAWPRAR